MELTIVKFVVKKNKRFNITYEARIDFDASVDNDENSIININDKHQQATKQRITVSLIFVS